jgi:hypothetical protein
MSHIRCKIVKFAIGIFLNLGGGSFEIFLRLFLSRLRKQTNSSVMNFLFPEKNFLHLH